MGAIMKKFIFMACFFSRSLLAQEPPQIVLDLSARGDNIVKKNEISKAQREYLWANTEADVDGFMRIDATTDTIDLPSQVTRFAKPGSIPKVHSRAVNSILARGYSSLGLVDEGGGRYTFSFGNPRGKIMYTAWEYKKSGATITRVEEFLNVNIKKNRGVLSLLVNSSTDKVLWKLTWLVDGVSHELYVEDLQNGRGTPNTNPKDIIEIAEGL